VKANRGHKPMRDSLLWRIFDISLAAVMLIIFLPLMALIVVLIKLNSRGPIFLTHRRVGWQGVPIDILKFRTMFIDSADIVITRQHTATGDPRVTRVGRVLRATSLDELPQLFNVLAGDLALIGPKAMLPYEIQRLEGHVSKELLQERIGYKPGLIGWAQVNGIRGGSGTVSSLTQMITLDVEYMKRRNIFTDIGIIIRTMIRITTRPNAY
jgi:polysaccharide biosynthesis protein PslA